MDKPINTYIEIGERKKNNIIMIKKQGWSITTDVGISTPPSHKVNKPKTITEGQLRKIIKETILNSIDKQLLSEATKVFCHGDKDWVDFEECAEKFIYYVDEFDKVFKILKPKIREGRDLSKEAKVIFHLIKEANNCIFKKDNYGFQRSELKPWYAVPIELMYNVKNAIGTAMLDFVIVQNKRYFSSIETQGRTDEYDRRVIDIVYKGNTIDGYHMPEKLQDLMKYITFFNKRFILRPEDTIKPDGSPNPNYDRKKDIYPSSLTVDYETPFNQFKKFLAKYKYDKQLKLEREKEFLRKQRMTAAKKGIDSGFIIPIFNNTEFPCVCKIIKKGEELFNAFPNAYENTKNDYLLKNENTGEPIWFKTYSTDGDTVEFGDSFPFSDYLGELHKDGSAFVYFFGNDNNNNTINENMKRGRIVINESTLRRIIKEVLSKSALYGKKNKKLIKNYNYNELSNSDDREKQMDYDFSSADYNYMPYERPAFDRPDSDRRHLNPRPDKEDEIDVIFNPNHNNEIYKGVPFLYRKDYYPKYNFTQDEQGAYAIDILRALEPYGDDIQTFKRNRKAFQKKRPYIHDVSHDMHDYENERIKKMDAEREYKNLLNKADKEPLIKNK